MAAVGAYTVLISPGSGYPHRHGPIVQDLERPGLDGVDRMRLARRAEPFQWNTFADCADLSTAAALNTAYHALRGTLVTLTDWNGGTWTNVIVKNVVTRVGPLWNSTGFLAAAGNRYAVEAVWTFELTDYTV